MRAASSGTGFAPLLVGVSAALFVGGATRAAPPQDLVEMEVLGVVAMESEVGSVLVLRQKGEQAVLPIFVGRNEGAAIELRLKGATETRLHASDLLANAIAALGGKVTRVEIQGVHSAIFHARVMLEQGGKRLELEGRPSDSVALALAQNAPIFATRTVMAEAGLTPSDLDRVRAPKQEENPGMGPEQKF
jgi:bifunctional DNase/RNase